MSDKFAGRYGWEHEKILHLPASDFIGYYAAIKAGEREVFNQQLKASAFTAWRVEVALSSLLGGQAKINFVDYCEKMGLLTEKEIKQNAALKKIQEAQNRLLVKEASARADEIMRIDLENQAKLRAQQEAEKGGG